MSSIPRMNTFDLIMLFLAVGGIFFGVYAWYDSSHQISNLQNELNSSINSNREAIILAMHESDDIGLNTTSRNNYFLSRFGISYNQASQILDYTNKTDDYSLGISSLDHQDYNASLNYFNLALIKNPSNVESNIGKAAALIGLNQTNDARTILFEIEPIYKNKAYVDKLMGDSYYNDGDYENATNYYLDSLHLYNPTHQDESNIFERLGDIKTDGLYNSPQVSISYYQGGKGKVISVYYNNSGMAYTKLPGPN